MCVTIPCLSPDELSHAHWTRQNPLVYPGIMKIKRLSIPMNYKPQFTTRTPDLDQVHSRTVVATLHCDDGDRYLLEDGEIVTDDEGVFV